MKAAGVKATVASRNESRVADGRGHEATALSLSERGRHYSVLAVITLTWAAVILPSLVQSFTAPKYRVFTNDTVPFSAQASLINLALTVGLFGVCVLLILANLRRLPVDRRGVLFVLLLPWIYQISRDLYAETPLKLGGLLYPLIVVVIWMLRPRLEHLAIVGYLVGFTATLSVLMGVFFPRLGVLSSVTGKMITPEKQIIPWGILIGPLTDGNPLGQFLVLGLPAIFFIARPLWRLPLAGVTAFAILWTSSRSSLAAIALGLLVAAVITAAPPRAGRRAVTGLMLTVLAGIVAYLPLTTTRNDAFTNRGYIWRASLRFWQQNPWLGLGSQWYSQSAKYTNNIGDTAFHGHNQFVQTMMLGGLVNLAVTALLLIFLIRTAASWAELHNVKIPAAFTAMFFLSSAFEVTLGFAHRSFLLPVVMLPIAIILLAPGRELAVDRPLAPWSLRSLRTSGTAGPEPEEPPLPLTDIQERESEYR